MSTPTSRQPARGVIQTPPASQSTRPPTLAKPESFSVEPKSEFLRNALHARRAKDATPASSPVDPKPPVRPASSASADPWLDNATSEEEISQVTQIRRARRPSEGSHAIRRPTQRELETETEKLKQLNFDLGLKCNLLKDQNNKLKDALEAANERIEELEPMEEENIDLREDNDRLKFKLQDLEEKNVELQDRNAAILRIQEDTVVEMEQRYGALEEAADMIFRLERENAGLKAKNSRLNEQVTNCHAGPGESDYYSTEAGESSPERYPTRIYSIDESRPSTSHIDSDYYSQPASPQVKSNKTSPNKQTSNTFSERAKNFAEMNVAGRRSIQELKKRVSEASIGKKTRPKSPVPEVPRIPENMIATLAPKSIKRTNGRHRIQSSEPSSGNVSRDSPAKNSPPTPRTPTAPAPGHGLRDFYQNGQPIKRPQPPSSYKSPTTVKSPVVQDVASGSPSIVYPLPRSSSRHAHTSSSNERLHAEAESQELAEPSPPPTLDNEDLITEPGTQNQDKWWQDLNNLQGHAGQRFHTPARPSGSRARRGSLGGDFFFNGSENEEQFVARAKQQMGRRGRQIPLAL
ncbi:hypothetical protein K469DRAFT_600169 [Zopfia rhizophila CBS 207.26]|uniref:Centrosomin N-terminal motif 1 domain-containing protein n=1 Tax=Zopfia rhizophila CBS 207.26 TaxID=1314779 RepID=A0A6A6DGR5_9PEZI|nr:hypothetical protein K469DRAFT_600169 [Zopfia rhizophila CBS 207.26]